MATACTCEGRSRGEAIGDYRASCCAPPVPLLCSVCVRVCVVWCCVVLCECNTHLLLLRILTSRPPSSTLSSSTLFLSFNFSLFFSLSFSLFFFLSFFFFSFLLRYRAVADQMDQAGSGLAGSAEGGPEPYVV